MRGGQECLPVTNLRRIVGRRRVQDVSALNFLELGEGFLKLQIRRIELGFVEVIVDRLAGDRIAKSNFLMDEVPDKPLAGIVVELGGRALVLEVRQTHEAHLSAALDGHV